MQSLTIGVHLIRTSFSIPKAVFFDGEKFEVDGGWGHTFLILNFLYITMVNTLNIEVYKCAQKICLGFYIFNKLGSCLTFIKKWLLTSRSCMVFFRPNFRFVF